MPLWGLAMRLGQKRGDGRPIVGRTIAQPNKAKAGKEAVSLRKHYKQLSVIATALGLALQTTAFAVETPTVTATNPVNPMTIDGQHDGWKLDYPMQSKDASQGIRDGNTWKGTTDCS
jgi:hypothetical protein